MDPNNLFSDIKINDVVLWILGIATIVSVLETNGFLPNRIAKYLAKNRLENTLNALRRLDVRVCWEEGTQSVKFIDRALDAINVKELSYKRALRFLLSEDTFKGAMQIGGTTAFSSAEFIDVMGATTNSARAIQYAKLLRTHCTIENLPAFDVIATPRLGSPILGYEFARLSERPFLMDTSDKVDDKEHVMSHHSKLDYLKSFDLNGKTVMLVDDSTTGGRKQVELAKKLRAAGAIVNVSLVLFEPLGKGARDKLNLEKIKLHAIIDGPAGNY